MSDKKHKKGVVAFSGGLDTSMLVPYVREHYGLENVVTCVVDTGAMTDEIKDEVTKRADEVGSDEHVCIDAAQDYYDEIIKYSIFGHVSRDGYPLSVGSERLIQAREIIKFAKDRGIDLVANGCTGAGNDQYRFDLVAQVLGGGIDTITPVREHGIKREFSVKYLQDRGISVSDKAKYSYNAGLWGVSIGGDETHTAQGLIPEEAWYSQPDTARQGELGDTIEIAFEKGEPVALKTKEGNVTGALDVIRKLGEIGSAYGIGRHYHVGTSIPGKKGRIAYESPAADILYEAHRTIEKHVMTQTQISFKKNVADEFGRLIHEAYFFDPLLDDLKAYLAQSQSRVSGVTTVHLKPSVIAAVTVDTPYDLLAGSGSVYGEFSDAYDARDAEGSAKIHGYEQAIYQSLNSK